MNPVREFAVFYASGFAEPTRRIYIGACRRALFIVGRRREDCHSYEELLALLTERKRQDKLPKGLRIGPFLRFLQSKVPHTRLGEGFSDARSEAIRSWVFERIGEETRSVRPSIFVRRDLAMLAALCAAPEKGWPRSWPKSALTVVSGTSAPELRLWGRPLAHDTLALPLHYWMSWRDRLDRPDQSRLYRKSWAYSDLLFPNAKGEVLQKQALHNALARLSVPGEGPVRVTPVEVRAAFLRGGS
jgi:hypothetical protein